MELEDKINDRIQIIKARNYTVVKGNDIIQKARFDLTVVEQKSVAYIVSLIKPNKNDLEYEFSIRDYCKICGIHFDSGGNYEYIKSSLKKLRDKSVWLKMPDGSETTISWINKVNINKRNGKAKIRLDDDMIPYLFDLKQKFTQYELYNTLAMKSQYSIRLYEIFKSYAFGKKKTFEIDELKKMLSAENYKNFKDFRIKVLEIAMKEINLFTDITVFYKTINKGRKIVKVVFEIINKNNIESTIAMNRTFNILDKEDQKDQIEEIEGQMSLDNYNLN